MNTFLYIFVTFLFVGSIVCPFPEIVPIKRTIYTTMNCPPTAEEMAAAIPMPLMSVNHTTGEIGLRVATCDGKYNAELMTSPTYYDRYPGSSIGKAFMMMGDSMYVCSASIADHNMIWTAGHCVYGPGYFGTGYSSQFCFVPGYYNNQKAVGYKAIAYYYPTQWGKGILQGFMEYDVALVQVPDKSFPAGTEFEVLSDNANNYDTNDYISNGYPAAGKFNGQLINTCKSKGCERDPNQTLKNTVGINCDSTGGCSGGPWIVQDRQTGRYKIAGVNSYGYSNRENVLFSPCFDVDIPNFKALVKSCETSGGC